MRSAYLGLIFITNIFAQDQVRFDFGVDSIEVNVGEEEKMFGSITNLDVHKELTAKGFDLEKSQIVIEEPIKALGIYHAKVKVAKDITSDVKLYVIKG